MNFNLILFVALWSGVFGGAYTAFENAEAPQFQSSLLNAVAAVVLAAACCAAVFILIEVATKCLAT